MQESSRSVLDESHDEDVNGKDVQRQYRVHGEKDQSEEQEGPITGATEVVPTRGWLEARK